ncbi:hypothetical protein [Amycolatopsis sp.]|jgi:hypothetical protein|uniref:hypothetical protein n=1 Tax=Amycolatopsis sp. TaxID=37632 RepID=UPI002E03F184|nr:hypothetical protein [Amycolatopsis sp.]
MSVRRFAAFMTLLAVTACGVQPTGVINAGDAPGLPDDRGTTGYVILYFVINGRLTGLSRQTPSSSSIPVALDLLLKGPTSTERANGATTFLPTTSSKASVSYDDIPIVKVSFPVLDLPQLAVSQLTCTALATARPSNTADFAVTLVGTDGKTEPRQCLP